METNWIKEGIIFNAALAIAMLIPILAFEAVAFDEPVIYSLDDELAIGSTLFGGDDE